MNAFLDESYLLTTSESKRIYAEIKELPIVDAHNHADVAAIRQNASYTDLWQIEAASDHYVWELLRLRGVEEELITGDRAAHDKWLAAAEVWPELAGNPTYEWVHLDLKRLLDIDDEISADTAEAIWDRAQDRLAQPEMRPQQLLQTMGVEVMCSTDDPVDSLEDHQALAADGAATRVRPTFRPDAAMNAFKPQWPAYIKKLEERTGTKCKHISDLIAALQTCHDYFAEHGCRSSDHGVEVPYGYQVDEADADQAFRKARRREELSVDELVGFMAYVLNEVAEMDAEKGWTFQLHMGCVRDTREVLEQELGADSGGDISDHMVPIVEPLVPFLNRFDQRLQIVLYALDPNHQPTLTTLCRAFGQTVSLGSAWWLNDSPTGMKQQLEYIASVGLLANHAGMVSDSRKLLSYASRHEMFRRCLADVLGTMVNTGRVPEPVATKLAIHLACERPREVYNLA